jgi:hypothetical protein
MEFKRKKSCAKKTFDFDPIKGCMHPFIASGPTPIGIAGRTPDEIETRRREKKTIFLSLYSKIFDYSLGGYSHREHWSCTRWRWNILTTYWVNHWLHCLKYQRRNLLFHSHREGFVTNWRKTTQRFWVLKLPNKAHDKLMTLKPHHHDKKLECHDRKDHEGKTSGSVLHGLVYAHECALLVNFHIHDAKKNPGGCTGYLEKY